MFRIWGSGRLGVEGFGFLLGVPVKVPFQVSKGSFKEYQLVPCKDERTELCYSRNRDQVAPGQEEAGFRVSGLG